ncbi:diacylglycerol kinase family protein [Candidatus Parcubacteria bacterium]|nr:diacylglycerol kinase family protein [Candidatus Parcubacteria bacterium]
MKSKANLLESNRFAVQGIKFSFSERSTRIHYLAVICTTATGLVLKVSTVEWCAIFIMFALVISLEMVIVGVIIFAPKIMALYA